jgi:hypothetical protein
MISIQQKLTDYETLHEASDLNLIFGTAERGTIILKSILRKLELELNSLLQDRI